MTFATLKIFVCKYHSQFSLALSLSYSIFVNELSNSDAYAMPSDDKLQLRQDVLQKLQNCNLLKTKVLY